MISTLVKVDGKWTKGPNITLNLEDGESYFVRIQDGKYKINYKEITEKEYQKAAKKIQNVFEYEWPKRFSTYNNLIQIINVEE